MQILIVILFYMLVSINIFDIISTNILLNSKLFYEANPIMDYLIQNFGFDDAMRVKFSVLFILGLCLLLYFRKKDFRKIKLVMFVLLVADIYYFILIGMTNFRHLLTLS